MAGSLMLTLYSFFMKRIQSITPAMDWPPTSRNHAIPQTTFSVRPYCLHCPSCLIGESITWMEIVKKKPRILDYYPFFSFLLFVCFSFFFFFTFKPTVLSMLSAFPHLNTQSLASSQNPTRRFIPSARRNFWRWRPRANTRGSSCGTRPLTRCRGTTSPSSRRWCHLTICVLGVWTEVRQG